MCNCYASRKLGQEDQEFLGYSVVECLSRMYNGQFGKKNNSNQDVDPTWRPSHRYMDKENVYMLEDVLFS